jgi:hypothetical protein
MTEEEIQAALALLPKRLQVGYLAGCVEHAYPACVANSIVSSALELAWRHATTGAADGAEVAHVSAELNRTLDDDSDTALVHVASAAELVVKALTGPNNVVVQVLNNIEAAIDVVDPQSDLGIAEERRWQEKALTTIQGMNESSLTRDVLGGGPTDVMGWQLRMNS